MKRIIAIAALGMLFTHCGSMEDDTNVNCTADCTTVSGKFVTLNNEPVPNVKVTLQYRKGGGELLGLSIRKLVDTNSGSGGTFYDDFHVNDDELGPDADGYFILAVDDSRLDVNKYIRQDNNTGTVRDMGYVFYEMNTRDTIIGNTFYIPKKGHVKVNLQNFLPVQPDDYFQVVTLYPFGPEVGYNEFLDSPYASGFSGYDAFKATGTNTTVQAFVAKGERNIIRVVRRKDGQNTVEDFPIDIPAGENNIELTYSY